MVDQIAPAGQIKQLRNYADGLFIVRQMLSDVGQFDSVSLRSVDVAQSPKDGLISQASSKS